MLYFSPFPGLIDDDNEDDNDNKYQSNTYKKIIAIYQSVCQSAVFLRPRSRWLCSINHKIAICTVKIKSKWFFFYFIVLIAEHSGKNHMINKN